MNDPRTYPEHVRPATYAVIAGRPPRDEGAPVTYRTPRFEAFRAIFGRRSHAQIVRRFEGSDEPEAYVPLLCVFGPAENDIIE